MPSVTIDFDTDEEAKAFGDLLKLATTKMHDEFVTDEIQTIQRVYGAGDKVAFVGNFLAKENILDGDFDEKTHRLIQVNIPEVTSSKFLSVIISEYME